MSLSRARSAIRLENTDKMPWWENIAHPDFVRSRQQPGEDFQSAYLRLVEEYDLDFVQQVNVKYEKILGTASPPMDADEDDIYDFDPLNPPEGVKLDYVETFGIHPSASVEQMAEHFGSRQRAAQQTIGERAMVPGAMFHQAFHYFSTTFGFENTAYAAYGDPARFASVVERCAELTHKVLTAWSLTDVELMICHDDLAMVDRSIFPPDWYAEFIFPWYPKVWEPLLSKGKRIVFFSDGCMDSLIPYVKDFGISGFFADDMVNLDAVECAIGPDYFALGNAKVNTITSGSLEDIEAEVRRAMAAGKGFRQRIMLCSGGLPFSIPAENVACYLDTVARLR